jgi:superfamily II DNA/RNA helicase
MTLSRFIESYEKFIEMVKSGKVYISKKVNVYDLLDDGDTKRLMYFIEQEDVMAFDTSDFEPKLLKDLERDLAELKYLQGLWGMIKFDPKLQKFRYELQHNKYIKGNKVIVFTESTETAEYLYDQLRDIYGKRIVCFSGKSTQALKVEIEDSFNPKNKAKENDKYDLLITTDVLAEGINLHRANVLVNYDLPWNPTRIMQRVGRINRVGTEFDRIYVFNFFPTAQSAQHMPLEDRILDKLQAFHDTLGEDFKYLSEEEEVSSQKLFKDLNRNLDEEEAALIALVENVQRENLNFIEEARAYKKLMDEFHLTQSEIALKVGKQQSTISNKIRILSLPEDIQEVLTANKLTERHGRALLRIAAESDRKKIINRIVKNNLNVKQSEKLIDEFLAGLEEQRRKKNKINYISYKIYVNTIRKSFAQIKEMEEGAVLSQEDKGDFLELKITIPKKDRCFT